MQALSSKRRHSEASKTTPMKRRKGKKTKKTKKTKKDGRATTHPVWQPFQTLGRSPRVGERDWLTFNIDEFSNRFLSEWDSAGMDTQKRKKCLLQDRSIQFICRTFQQLSLQTLDKVPDSPAPPATEWQLWNLLRHTGVLWRHMLWAIQDQCYTFRRLIKYFCMVADCRHSDGVHLAPALRVTNGRTITRAIEGQRLRFFKSIDMQSLHQLLAPEDSVMTWNIKRKCIFNGFQQRVAQSMYGSFASLVTLSMPIGFFQPNPPTEKRSLLPDTGQQHEPVPLKECVWEVCSDKTQRTLFLTLTHGYKVVSRYPWKVIATREGQDEDSPCSSPIVLQSDSLQDMYGFRLRKTYQIMASIVQIIDTLGCIPPVLQACIVEYICACGCCDWLLPLAPAPVIPCVSPMWYAAPPLPLTLFYTD